MKRVRFADLDANNTTGQKLDASPITAKTIAPEIESPRTSEYRSYKRLREDAAHSLRCYQIHKSNSDHRKLQFSNSVAEMNNTDRRHKNEECRLVLPLEKVAPIGSVQRVKSMDLNQPHLHAGTSRNSGLDHVDIFSEKRQKILCLASEALLLGVDEFSSKGPDLIAELLRRIGIETDSGTISKSRQMDSDSGPLICSPKPSPKSGVYFEDDSPEVWLKETEEMTRFSHWDSESACQQISEFKRSLPLLSNYDVQEAGFGSNRSGSYWTQFDRNRFFRLDHMRFELDLLDCENMKSSRWQSLDRSLILSNELRFGELNKIYNRDKTRHERENSLQLLGWSDNSLNYESDNVISSPTMQLSLDAKNTGLTSFDDPGSIMLGACSSLVAYPVSTPCQDLLPGGSSPEIFSVYPFTTPGRYFIEEGEKPDCFTSEIPNIRDASFLDFMNSQSGFCIQESMYGLHGSLNKGKTCKLLLDTSGWGEFL